MSEPSGLLTLEPKTFTLECVNTDDAFMHPEEARDRWWSEGHLVKCYLFIYLPQFGSFKHLV